MWYLFLQIWIWLAAAFILGWLSHWFWCCRDSNKKANQVISPLMAEQASSTANTQNKVVVKSPKDNPDDLKQIKGIGRILSATLNDELGIYQFAQIAAWTDTDIAEAEKYLNFSGRVQREDWVGQAKILASGGSTEFAARVVKGDLEY